MTIGCKTRRPGEGVSYRRSHYQTVRVGRSALLKKKTLHLATVGKIYQISPLPNFSKSEGVACTN